MYIYFFYVHVHSVVSNVLLLGERWVEEGFGAVRFSFSSNEKPGGAIKPKFKKVLHRRDKFEKTILISSDKLYKLWWCSTK